MSHPQHLHGGCSFELQPSIRTSLIGTYLALQVQAPCLPMPPTSARTSHCGILLNYSTQALCFMVQQALTLTVIYLVGTCLTSQAQTQCLPLPPTSARTSHCGTLSQLQDTSYMFYGASSFNSDLSGWNTANVEKMYAMFGYAQSFNSDLSLWNVSNVWTLYAMFYGAQLFHSDLSRWKVSNARTMYAMFYDAQSFNSDISPWNVSNTGTMYAMFYGAKSFNQNLCPWGDRLRSRTNTSSMFWATNCSSPEEPVVTGTPPGPFCYNCSVVN